MGKYNIELVTMQDCNDFVSAVSKCDGKIILESADGFRVNGKSLIGALASMEWDKLYCISERDIYNKIERWIVNDYQEDL